MSKKTMIDTAYDVFKSKGCSLSFKELWTLCAVELGLTEQQQNDKIALFYTQLTLDGRFVLNTNNSWDLKEKFKFGDERIKSKVEAIELEDNDNLGHEDEEENYNATISSDTDIDINNEF